jgi:heme/copper-type cytochrome/quinol oxidase subunit 2
MKTHKNTQNGRGMALIFFKVKNPLSNNLKLLIRKTGFIVIVIVSVFFVMNNILVFKYRFKNGTNEYPFGTKSLETLRQPNPK